MQDYYTVLASFQKNAGYGYSDDNGYHPFTPKYFTSVSDLPPGYGSDVGASPIDTYVWQLQQQAIADIGNDFSEDNFLRVQRFIYSVNPDIVTAVTAAGWNYPSVTLGSLNIPSLDQVKGYFLQNGFPDPKPSNSLWTDMLGVAGVAIGNAIKQWSKNPLQAALGANTPIAAKTFNAVLGTDFKPVVSDTGGYTQDNFQQAQQKGYDTEADETLTFFASTIAAGTAAGMGVEALSAGAAVDATGGTFVGDVPIAGEGGTSIFADGAVEPIASTSSFVGDVPVAGEGGTSIFADGAVEPASTFVGDVPVDSALQSSTDFVGDVPLASDATTTLPDTIPADYVGDVPIDGETGTSIFNDAIPAEVSSGAKSLLQKAGSTLISKLLKPSVANASRPTATHSTAVATDPVISNDVLLAGFGLLLLMRKKRR